MSFLEGRQKPSDTNLIDWFRNEAAFDRTLASIRGEPISTKEGSKDNSQAEDMPNLPHITSAVVNPHALSNNQLFVRGFLLNPLEIRHPEAVPDTVRILCSSLRPEVRDRFGAIFSTVGEYRPVVGHAYVNMDKKDFNAISETPITRAMLEDIQQFSPLLSGAIAGQRALAGERELHRLTVHSPQLAVDFISIFRTHFSFKMGRVEAKVRNPMVRTIEYKYPPVRARLLGVSSVSSLPFIDRVLPPFSGNSN